MLHKKVESRGSARWLKYAAVGALGVLALTFAVACGDSDEDAEDSGGTGSPAATQAPRLSGSVAIDGSSTVFPITEAVAEEFRKEQSGVQVTVGIAGTGGGFTRFCNGETSISDASRPITQKEIDACAAKGIEYVEIPVAYDGLSVIVNPQNTWATCLTVAELKTIWQPEAQGKITNWNQVRSSFPDAPLKLYGPGTDSGTFDYFTEVINGKADASRGDYTASEDDNVLVQGVAGDKNALGYFGLAYYEENKGKLKDVQVDGGKGCVAPSAKTVEDGSYAPLSRPLFIYVKKADASKPEVKAFVDYYLDNVAELSAEVGYVKFPDSYYPLIEKRWSTLKVGTMYANAPAGSTLQSLLSAP